jgi:transitional endoplasmic reticulum ATPase
VNVIARPWSELPPDRPPRGIVRLSRKDMRALGVGAGAVLSVSGDRVAYARAFPAAVQGPVGLDAIVVANAAPRGRPTIELQAAEVVAARRVECQVLEGDAPSRDSLVHFTVSAGDTLPLGRGRNVRVVACTPAGPATITSETVVAFRASGGGPKEPGFLALGGLAAEIARVREMIELPMRRPDLFTRLGIDPPRGVLLIGPPGTGKTMLARAVAQECGASFFSIAGPEIVSKHFGDTEAQLRAIFERAAKEAPSVVFIDEIDAIAPRRDGVGGERQLERRMVAQLLTLMDGMDARNRVVVMAATNMPDSLDPALRRPGRFDREIEISAPDREGRRAILAAHTRFMPLAPDVDLDALAATTHGFVGADLAAIAREAGMAAIRRQPTHDLTVTAEDFQVARLEVAPSALRDVAVDVPDVRFSAIGGLDDVKAALAEAVLLPIAHADLFDEFGVRPPRGVLLVGPPGVGKTMLAKALANEAGVNFLSVRGAELLDRYVGASEEAIRRVFAKARRASPVILFFDEIDALAPPRGADSSGVMDRLVAALLTEIDGVEELRGVFLLGATNRLAAVDPALRRPGRFDAVIVVPPPNLAARRAIAALHASGLGLGSQAFDRIAAATEGRVGADIAAVCQRLGLAAVRRAVAGDRAPASDADIDEAVAALAARSEGA